MCANSQCVTITINDGEVCIADSKLGEPSPVIVIPLERWRTTPPASWFVPDTGCPGWHFFRDPLNHGPALRFDQAELDAFLEKWTAETP